MNHGPTSVLDRLQGFIEKDSNKKSKRRRINNAPDDASYDGREIEDVDANVKSDSAMHEIDAISVEICPQAANASADFFPIRANTIDHATIAPKKLRRIQIMRNLEIYGCVNSIFSAPGVVSSEVSEQATVRILPCRNLTELGEIYGFRMPRIWKNMASFPAFNFTSNYSKYLSSSLALYGDIFVENNIPPDSPVNDTSAVIAPILVHMLGHVVNMRTVQVKNSAKKKAALLLEETDAAIAASEDAKRKDKKVKRKLKQDLIQARINNNNSTNTGNGSSISDAQESSEDDHFHDAGFTRPRVLILCPFRSSALSIVNNMIRLLNGQVAKPDNADSNDLSSGPTIVSNYDKLLDEFSYLDEDEEEGGPAPSDKPVDWQRYFHCQNSDDDFKMGVQINPGQGRPLAGGEADDADNESGKVKSKNKGVGLRLFSEFYSSDIIIASPIGLRFVLENHPGKVKSDKDGKTSSKSSVASDFLSSLECIYLHQADVLHMQNWEHVEFVLKHSNRLPTMNSTQIDYSRVRPYFLNEEGKLHRQLIVSSAFNDPSIQAAFRHYGTSCAGTVRLRVSGLENTVNHRYAQIKQDGYISQVVIPVNQIFQLILCKSFADEEEVRFEHFKEHILTPVLRSNQPHTLIIAPSYLHYVRIRNELLKREANAAFICEYSRDSEISRGRSRFIHGQNSILLYSGRAHFFRRYKIRGALNLIFYSLPEYPHFYSEFCNMLESSERVAASVAVRKHKEVFATDADPHAVTNSYTSTTDAMKKKTKKRLREQANERAQAALRQSSYTPEEIRAMDNSCVVLITEFDKLLLTPIVGAQRTDHILSSGKSTFMFH